MTGAHQWEDNAAVQSGGRNRIWRERQNTRKLIQQGGEIIVMDIVLAIVDFLADSWVQPTRNPCTQTQTDWSCGLTARKEGTYQRSSKRKRRRSVPADRVYYIQSAYPFQ